MSLNVKLYRVCLVLALLLGAFQLPATDRLNNQNVTIVRELSNIYRASMVYIFKNQHLIENAGVDKSPLFGQSFIDNIKRTYEGFFKEPFPEQDHLLKKMMIQVMIEVMEDNRTLIYDDDLSYKGFIPAIFAFQISEKISTKNLGLKIKFTNFTDKVRNKLNKPDPWEISAMVAIKKNQLPRFFERVNREDAPDVIRYFTPVELEPMCLSCHGSAKDNPLNKNKRPSQWSTTDITGFAMEGWKLEDFVGGVSVTVNQLDLYK